MTFGKLIHRSRLNQGLSQREIGERLNLKASVISLYELDIISPSFLKAQRIADVLNIDLDKLLGKKYRKKGAKEKNFGLNLRIIRKGKGLTQEELARKIKTTRFLINKYENNRTMPNLLVVIKLAKIFKCSLYEFIAEH